MPDTYTPPLPPVTRVEHLLYALGGGETWTPEVALTRWERYLMHIDGGSIALPARPITREEQYLHYIASGSGDIPEHPITRVEQYLECKATGEGELPEKQITRLEAYLRWWIENSGGPDHITITSEPTKLVYNDGETIDFTGLVVVAYNDDGTVWDDKYEGGVIPLEKLTFPVTTAHFEGE